MESWFLMAGMVESSKEKAAVFEQFEKRCADVNKRETAWERAKEEEERLAEEEAAA
ncbi:MAG: hypothetical protein IIB77_06915 [Proteobacteria bacterium]|nr:hypothetical protein [Pseudomonadota bacterium]